MIRWIRRLLVDGASARTSTNGQGMTDEAQALKERGNACLAAGDLAAAEACYRQAICVAPRYADAHNNLGLALTRQGLTEAGLASFRHALTLEPRLVQAYLNAGNSERSLGHFEEALRLYVKASSIAPEDASARNNLGALLRDLGRTAEAMESFEAAIQLNPGLAEAHYNRGDLCHELGRLGDALESLAEAIRYQPGFADALNTMGIVYREQGQFDRAQTCFDQALALRPDFARAHNNLGTLALDRGRQAEAYAHFRQALAIDLGYSEAHSNLLFAMQYDASCSSAELFSAHVEFGERIEAPLRPAWPAHRSRRDPDRQLRVGFVSGDFRAHPVGYFLENVLSHLDRQLIDITLFPTAGKSDAVTDRLRALELGWHSLLGLSDEQAARHITDAHIDILVDLSGHTAGNRLPVFARKPAPVQVSWLYFSSTGMCAMDYLLCDRHVVPSAEARYLVETPYHLPDSYLCFTPPREEVAVDFLPATVNGYITFGAFNNLVKMNPAVVALWARTLQAVPGSRLFMKAGQLDDGDVRAGVVERFAVQGISAERLILEGASPRIDYLSCYNRVDVALDPFPFPGGTTTVEALWMGVPVITRAGQRFISHAGESILHTAGLDDWVARDDEGYIAIARRFASNLPQLAALRAGLRQRFLASPLCDGPRFARNLETAFRAMWQDSVRTEPASSAEGE